MSRPQEKKVSQPEIRLALSGDEAAIAEVLFEAFSMSREGYTPEAFAAVTPDANEVSQRFEEGANWVATLDGEIVGTVSVVPEPEWLYIRSLGIRPTALRLGIASKLLSTAEEYARE